MNIKCNRYWGHAPQGDKCDRCGQTIIGFLFGMMNKKTRRVLCNDCYITEVKQNQPPES